jgi:hypothetical protein
MLSMVDRPQLFLTNTLKVSILNSYNLLLANGNSSVRHLSRWNSIMDGSAKSVFSCLPNDTHKSFTSPIFACIICQHLGLPHAAVSKFSQLVQCGFCETWVDPAGTHFVDCKSNGVVGRHDAVKHIISALCSSEGISNQEEVRNLDPDSEDVTIPRWNHSAAWIDTAVVSPSCLSHMDHSARTPTYSLDLTANNKRKKYAALVEEAGVSYIPFVMDVYGSLNVEGHKCLQRIASIGARLNGISWKSYYRESRLKLVCSVLSSTAKQILNGLNV